jgi:pimeloyl-ACP methyl ester carboxylesterase
VLFFLNFPSTPAYGKQRERTVGTGTEATLTAEKEKWMDATRVFIHGLDSSSRGTKGTFFRERYPRMWMEDFSGPLDERMAQLTDGLAGRDNLILVGSSYGGLMAVIFALGNEPRVRRMILLAPALGHADLSACPSEPLGIPVTLYHGRHDDVVLPLPTRRIAEGLFTNLDYHLVEDDHNLHRVFPTLDWNKLLEIEPNE